MLRNFLCDLTLGRLLLRRSVKSGASACSYTCLNEIHFCPHVTSSCLLFQLPSEKAQMASIVDELGPFDSAGELRQGGHPQNWVLAVLRRWTHLLEFDLFHSHLEADVDGRKCAETFLACSADQPMSVDQC